MPALLNPVLISLSDLELIRVNSIQLEQIVGNSEYKHESGNLCRKKHSTISPELLFNKKNF